MKRKINKLHIDFKVMQRSMAYFVIAIFLTYCNNVDKKANQTNNTDTAAIKLKTNVIEHDSAHPYQSMPFIQYSETTLNNFLDSIGHLNTSKLKEKITHNSDSVFKNRHDLNVVLNAKDFKELKQACKSMYLNLKTARRIFKYPIDTNFISNNKVLIEFHSFDNQKTDFKDYAIYIGVSGMDWENDLYFFKANRLISHHHNYHHFDSELNHFKDADSNTVVYYIENFGSGTGIWQYNYFFYKYIGNKLKPVLNILQNGNLNNGPDDRRYWFETFISSTNPLKLKFNYNWNLPDANYKSIEMQRDSTEVVYTWDSINKIYVGNYNDKINQNDFPLYYTEENEVYAINLHYKDFKSILRNKYNKKRKVLLYYLNNIKNYLSNYTKR